MLDMMPEQATSWAAQVDWINNFITYVSAFCTLAITGVMIIFAVRYRQKDGKDHETPYVTHNAVLESIWTVVPTLVCIFVFYYGLVVYQDMRNVPANALEVQVKGFQWRWEFLYPNGTKSTNELVVPVDTPIRLVMTSDDVLHSFFIPSMRTKEDVVPGKYSYLWFQPEKLGEYPIFCTEYCGLQHAKMLAQLRVVSNEQYQDYILETSSVK
jgi:cytochrome c oxidase subunit 2